MMFLCFAPLQMEQENAAGIAQKNGEINELKDQVQEMDQMLTKASILHVGRI